MIQEPSTWWFENGDGHFVVTIVDIMVVEMDKWIFFMVMDIYIIMIRI
jgi:hypothetical protein